MIRIEVVDGFNRLTVSLLGGTLPRKVFITNSLTALI